MNKKDFYSIHSDCCKTLSNPKRQEILDTLRDREMTVNDLAKTTGISQSNLSQHLAILRSKGILTTRRQGSNVYYSITNLKIIEAFDLISEVLQEDLATQTMTIKVARRGKV